MNSRNEVERHEPTEPTSEENILAETPNQIARAVGLVAVEPEDQDKTARAVAAALQVPSAWDWWKK